MANSDTPRTDAFAESVHEGQCLSTCDSFAHDPKCPVCFGEQLIADFARTLERELAEVIGEHVNCDAGWSAECKKLSDERDALKRENAALRDAGLRFAEYVYSQTPFYQRADNIRELDAFRAVLAATKGDA